MIRSANSTSGNHVENRNIEGLTPIAREDPVTESYRKTDQTGNEASGTLDSPSKIEFDPLSGSIPTIDPLTDPLLSQPSSMRFFKHAGDVNRPEYGCVIDGQQRSDARDCNRALRHGAGRLSEAHDQPVEILRELGIQVRWVPTTGRPKPDPTDSPDKIRVSTQEPGGKWEYTLMGAQLHGPLAPSNDSETQFLPVQKDPCAGRKGKLDFKANMASHIFPNHIAASSKPDKSKYTFWPWQRTRAQYESQVESFGKTTFENGRAAIRGNYVAYTYAFPGVDADTWWFREVGVVGLEGGEKAGHATNVNTVVVSSLDCKTVITAYPGLPTQFGPSDIPGAIFKVGGWSTQHKYWK